MSHRRSCTSHPSVDLRLMIPAPRRPPPSPGSPWSAARHARVARLSIADRHVVHAAVVVAALLLVALAVFG